MSEVCSGEQTFVQLRTGFSLPNATRRDFHHISNLFQSPGSYQQGLWLFKYVRSLSFPILRACNISLIQAAVPFYALLFRKQTFRVNTMNHRQERSWCSPDKQMYSLITKEGTLSKRVIIQFFSAETVFSLTPLVGKQYGNLIYTLGCRHSNT